MLFVALAVSFLVGWLIRPRLQEAPDVVGPSIVVLASQQNISATVTSALSVGGAHGRHTGTLRLTLVATKKFIGTLHLAIVLNDFPSGTKVTGAKLLPVKPPDVGSVLAALPVAPSPHPPHYGDFAFPATLGQPGKSSSAAIKITILAPRPIGENRLGAQFRVAFPLLRGEGPGVSPSVGYRIKSLFPGATSLIVSPQGYPMALQAGTSTFADSGVPLSGYQILAGDPPTLQGTTRWAWEGINDATVLAADVHAQDVEQIKVFWSGLAIGLALAALVALFLEVVPAESGTGSGEARARNGGPGGDGAAEDVVPATEDVVPAAEDVVPTTEAVVAVTREPAPPDHGAGTGPQA